MQIKSNAFIAGSKSQPINGPIWDESPIVCFENDKNKELAFKVMVVLVQKKIKIRNKDACNF